MTIQAKHDLPLTFRAEVVEPITRYLAAGDSCSVVGIGSVGKSNLLRFLQREDVRQAQLGDEWATYLFVYVDINKILKQTKWGLLELMLHQLMIELTNQGADGAALQTMDDLHQRATEPRTRYLALRYLDRAVRIACNQLGLRLVFLIDEFDDLCRTMSARGFGALRALRDDYKYRLMYVVATRLELRRLRAEQLEIEAFEELTSSRTIWLGPYSEDDARLMLRRLGARHNVTLDDKTIDDVLAATGRHPGLLREAYQVAREPQPDFFEVLASRSHVQDECQRIWFSLSPEEQRVMVSLAGEAVIQPYQIAVVERLRYKGLVCGPGMNDNRIFSPLVAEYIKQNHPIVGARVFLDHERHTVWVNGHEVRRLSRLEYKLLAYLERGRGKVFSRDEMARHLYPDDMSPGGAGVTDTRIDSVVKRLRKRIEPNPKAPCYIVTVRGHGFRWGENDEADR